MVMGRIVFLFLALNIIVLAECRNLKYSKRKRASRPDEAEERREVCIEDMGCYPNTNPGVVEGWTTGLSFGSMRQKLADTRKAIDTEFRWSAPGVNKTLHKVFTNFDFEDKFGEGFDAKLKVKFIIHGYNGGGAIWALIMRDAFMRKEQCNVFIVDWTKGAATIMYSTAVANTWVVGAEMGHLIQRLVEKFGVKLEDVHIIGHSLGAHTSGYAGKWVQYRLDNKVGRITGLDPAGPDFYDLLPGERLYMGDAAFVDVIHTNWAMYAPAGLGLFDPVGHFDFYPNGGADQPGCKTQTQALTSLHKNMTDEFACSHSRSIQLFIESMQNEPCFFFADQCTSWVDYEAGKCPPLKEDTLTVEMGYHADEYRQHIDATVHKSFFLYTNGEIPYCKPGVANFL